MINKENLIKKSYIIVLFTISTLIITTGGYLFFHYESKIIRQEKYNELKAIADLKVAQIEQWIKERTANTIVISKSPFLVAGVEKWLSDKKDSPLASDIQIRLSEIQKEYGFESVFLSSVTGEILFWAGNEMNKFDLLTMERIAEAVNRKQIVFTDFYYNKNENQIRYDIISPLVNEDNQSVAALIISIDPNDFLYPLIQNWPTPSKSSETIIIRKEQDSVLFLNELRHLKNSALRLKIPLTRTEAPAVHASLGHTGQFVGVDYRGIKVLADINNPSGINWIMLSKVDLSEIYSSLYITGGAIAIFTIFLIILFGLGFYGIYKARQKNIIEVLYNNEKELRVQQERFKVTINSLGSGVITAGVNCEIQFMNAKAEELTGWSLDDVIGRKLSEIYNVKNEETGQKENNILEKIKKFGIVKELANHTVLISKTGKELPVSDNGASVFDTNGSLCGIVITFQDETEKRMHQKIIKESEYRIRSTMDHMMEGCQIIGHDWRYLYINTTAEMHNRRPNTELLGKKYTDVWPGIEEMEIFSVIKKCLKKQISHRLEDEFLFPDGTKRWFLLNIEPVPEGVLILSEDITERKKMFDDLIMAKEKAEESDRLKSAFLTNMSHEIRTPMNGILGFISLLENPELSQNKQKEFFEIVKKSGDRLLCTINDIIEISKIEAGQSPVYISVLDLNEIMAEQVIFFKHEAEEKGILLKLQKGLDNNTIIKTDRNKLVSILTNLLKNALKFTNQGSIELGYNILGNQVTFFVKDTGVGIPQNRIEAIFNRFEQADLSISRGHEGSGLGLSIAKAYTELLGGKIWVESEEGKGSTFYFNIEYVPVLKNISETEEVIPLTVMPNSSRIILVAEDDQHSYILIQNILKDYKILYTDNGKEAVELFKQNPNIGLILMDIKMPVMGGIETTQQIRKLNKNIPIIAQTAHALEEEKKKALAEGCNDYITKPFIREELLRLIEKYLIN